MEIKTIIKNVGMELETKENRKYENVIINLKDVLYVCDRKRKVVDESEEVIGTVKLLDGRLLLMESCDKDKLYEDMKYIQNSIFTINLRFMFIEDSVYKYKYIVRCDMVESISESKFSERLSENISDVKLSSIAPVTSIKINGIDREDVIRQMHRLYSVTDEDKTFNIHGLAHGLSDLMMYMCKIITYISKNNLKSSEFDIFNKIYCFANVITYYGSGRGNFGPVQLSAVDDLDVAITELNKKLKDEITNEVNFFTIYDMINAIRNDEYNIGDLTTLIDIPFASNAVNKTLKILIEMKFYANRYRKDICVSDEIVNANTLLVNKGIREFNNIIKSKDIFRYIELINYANTYHSYHKNMYKYDIVLNRNIKN